MLTLPRSSGYCAKGISCKVQHVSCGKSHALWQTWRPMGVRNRRPASHSAPALGLRELFFALHRVHERQTSEALDGCLMHQGIRLCHRHA